MVNEIIAATSFAKWVSLSLVFVVLVTYLRRSHDFSNIVVVALIGAAIANLGWAIHRLYWWTWRMLEINGKTEAANWLEDHGDLTLFASIPVLAGTAMLMAPVSSAVLGKWWPYASAAFILLLFAIGFLLAI